MSTSCEMSRGERVAAHAARVELELIEDCVATARALPVRKNSRAGIIGVKAVMLLHFRGPQTSGQVVASLGCSMVEWNNARYSGWFVALKRRLTRKRADGSATDRTLWGLTYEGARQAKILVGRQ